MAITDIAAYALIDFTEYKAIANDANADENRTTAIINGVSESIAGYCNRDFIATEHTEIIDGNGRDELRLRHRPILDSDDSVSDPVLSIDDNLDGTWSAASTYNYTLMWTGRKPEGIVYFKYGYQFPRGKRNLKMVYTAGYANRAAVPVDLKEAVVEIVAAFKHKMEQQLHGVQTVNTMTETTSYKLDEWPAGARETIDRYRRISV